MLNLPPLDELQLAMRFDELRKQLADDHYRPLYGKILAFWAIPSDRRLPRALLNWTLQQVITSQFTDLAATPGIGKKKLQGLLMLLERAAQTDPMSLPAETTDQTPVAQQRESTPSEYLIRWQDVSELMWAEWCATVRKHGLQDVPLGRLAPALNRMTRVLWNIPLGEFLDMTIEDLREERSYGERRLSALLEVFGLLHQILKDVEPQSYLALELAHVALRPCSNGSCRLGNPGRCRLKMKSRRSLSCRCWNKRDSTPASNRDDGRATPGNQWTTGECATVGPELQFDAGPHLSTL